MAKKKGKKIATLELDEKYHSYTTYLIHSDNSQKMMDDLKEVPEFQFKTIDERNLILKTKLQIFCNEWLNLFFGIESKISLALMA